MAATATHPNSSAYLYPSHMTCDATSGTGRENQASLLACKYLRSCRDYDPVDEDLFGEDGCFSWQCVTRHT